MFRRSTEAVAEPAQVLHDLRVAVHHVRREALMAAVQDGSLQVGEAKPRPGLDALGCASVDEPSGPVLVPLDVCRRGCGPHSGSGTPRADPPAWLASSPSVVQRGGLCRFLLSFERADLSGLPAGDRKTCPAPAGRNTERPVWWTRSRGREPALCCDHLSSGSAQRRWSEAFLRSGGGRESNPPGSSRPHTGFEDRGAHQTP